MRRPDAGTAADGPSTVRGLHVHVDQFQRPARRILSSLRELLVNRCAANLPLLTSGVNPSEYSTPLFASTSSLGCPTLISSTGAAKSTRLIVSRIRAYTIRWLGLLFRLVLSVCGRSSNNQCVVPSDTEEKACIGWVRVGLVWWPPPSLA